MDNTLEQKIRQLICDDAKGHSTNCKKNDCQCGLTEQMNRLTPKLLSLCESIRAEALKEDKRQIEMTLEFHRDNEYRFRRDIKDDYGAEIAFSEYNKMKNLINKYFEAVLAKLSQEEE